MMIGSGFKQRLKEAGDHHVVADNIFLQSEQREHAKELRQVDIWYGQETPKRPSWLK